MIKVTFYNQHYKHSFETYDDINNLKEYSKIKTINCENNKKQKSITVRLPNYLEAFIWIFGKLESIPDRLPDTLIRFNCLSNKLTKIPQLPNKLTVLSVMANNITELPELPNTLKYLNCSNNNISSLPELPDSLKELCCNDNNLVVLPKLPSTLKTLLCVDNHIIKLPKLPDNIEKLYCCKNNIIEIENHEIYNKIPNYECMFYQNPIFEYIETYFEGDVAKHFKFIESYERTFANKIANWYLDCKYNPIYIKCREKIKLSYDELYCN